MRDLGSFARCTLSPLLAALVLVLSCFFFFSSRRRHTRCSRDWSSDVCSSDLITMMLPEDLTLVPKVVMIFNFRWYNTYLALIAPFLVNVFSIFLLRQFFMQIDRKSVV